MVGSIRELSDRLMELEAQLKVTHTHAHTHIRTTHTVACRSHLTHSLTSGFQMESVNKQQQSNEEPKEVKKGGGMDEFEGRDEEKERKTKENREMKNKEQADKHKKFQEASDTVCEGEEGKSQRSETDVDE